MTRFQAEIEQIPDAVERLAAWYSGDGRAALRDLAARVRAVRGLVWAGMGTSCFTPEVIFPTLSRLGISSRAVDAGEWLHYGTGAAGPGELAILTSQSGESVELRRLVERGMVKQGFIAVTNAPGSTIGRAAALTLPLHAGDEASISNKTYANTLALLHLVGATLVDAQAAEKALQDLRGAAAALRRADLGSIAEAAGVLAGGPGIAFAGRGPGFVTARQCALTFMEGTRRMAVALTGGAFNHGPAECLEKDFRLVVVRPAGAGRELADALAARAATIGARVVVMSDGPDPGLPGIVTVAVPEAPGAGTNDESLFPLRASRVQNLLLHEVAARQGHEAGLFRHGAKVTANE